VDETVAPLGAEEQSALAPFVAVMNWVPEPTWFADVEILAVKPEVALCRPKTDRARIGVTATAVSNAFMLLDIIFLTWGLGKRGSGARRPVPRRKARPWVRSGRERPVQGLVGEKSLVVVGHTAVHLDGEREAA
jgi:hypothetical protein